ADVAGIFLSALKSPVSHEAKELVGLLVANKRLSLLPEIAAQFHVLRNASEGAADVEITSAFPLEGAPLTELVATLERKFGKKLQAHVSVDPS
ncbi:F0F1 ATP synthase subunit delta, partial [Klebsiella pneumoniae]